MGFTNPAVNVTLAPGATVGISGGQLTNTAGTPVQPVSDQLTSGDLGTGADGTVTVTTNTTLVRDMQYTALTINAGVTLSVAGYVIRCTGTVTNNGTADCSGGAGGSTASTGLGAPTGSNGGGGNGTTQNGFSPPSADVEGGAGGNGNGSGYIGGTVTQSSAVGLSMPGLRSLRFSGGGGGGGGGGYGGGGGGVIIAFCGSTAGSGTWQALGGAGAMPPVAQTGGGGGGIVYIATRERGDAWTLSAAGGPCSPSTGSWRPGFPGRTGVLVCNGS